MVPRGGCALLVVLLAGCGTSARAVRLETGRAPPILFTHHLGDAETVKLRAREFKEALPNLGRDVAISAQPRAAARALFRSGSDQAYAHVRGHLGLVSVGPGHGSREGPIQGFSVWKPEADSELTRAYGRWCERTRRVGDCLHLLEDGPTLDEEGKRTLALHIALGSVLEETQEALGEMVNPEAVRSTIVSAMAVYLGLWLLPEPVSKGLAATLTACLVAYLGVDTVWNLVQGWRRLAREVMVATTFDELRSSGERYGKVLGENTARVFVMLATAAIGETAGLMLKAPRLPGSAQAVSVAEAQGGFRFTAMADVDAVALPAEGAVTISLAPGALAMTAQAMSAGSTSPVDEEGPWHHIASDKFSTSTNNGGPWTPRYQQLFDKAGLSLDDAANKVRVKGHKGPHPQAYHEEVFDRLKEATQGCRSIQQCREALLEELKALAEDISTPGTPLNKLVTRSP